MDLIKPRGFVVKVERHPTTPWLHVVSDGERTTKFGAKRTHAQALEAANDDVWLARASRMAEL